MDRMGKDRAGWLVGAGFAGFVLLVAALVLTKGYPSAFDELEHVSYAAYLQETHEWRPMFEAMRVLQRDSLVTWTSRITYLGHPSPFYWYETLFLDRSLPLAHGVWLLRAGSAALVVLGVGLALRAGMRQFGRDALALGVFCALLVLCPKLLAVAGQVTNDALAVLAGGLAYWGVCREQDRGRGAAGLASVGVALALACWAKPNAGLAVAAALGFCAVFRVWARPAWAAALAAGVAVGSLPYWLIVAKYAAVVPVTVEQVAPVASVPGFWTYLPAFLFTVLYTFCFDQTGTWPVPGLGAALAAALVGGLLACMTLGGVLAWRRGGTGWLMAVAGPLAVLAVLPIHFWFSLKSLGGSLPAASFRYYLPVWPFMAHAVAYGVAAVGRGPRWGIAALVAAALAVGWLSP